MQEKTIKIRKKAIIVFQDGTVFRGYSFGAFGTNIGEIVFNTSMSGYQEILTDPSYKGQIVTMTYPLIGNYGTNKDDVESRKPFLGGFIVKECSKIASNWRSQMTLEDYLIKNNIIGIEGVDTRAITRHIRKYGTPHGAISTEILDEKILLEKVRSFPGFSEVDLAETVTCDKKYKYNNKGKYHVIVIDCGVKYNILRSLEKIDCQVTVVPSRTSTQEILRLKPDGILISNGPGDPAGVKDVISTVRELLSKQIPIFGICLGQQILALAMGGKTYKLKFGHRGGNHPVKNLENGKIDITVQNHGFCVDINSLSKDAVITHINLNDQTLEGFQHKKLPFFSVQYHPEACPGPHDAGHLFNKFQNLMKKFKK